MKNDIENNWADYKKLNVYTKTLFVAGITAVITGLLFPAISGFVDILLVFAILLCTAVILITLTSSKPCDLSGFAALSIASAAILLMADIASSKLILSKTSGSKIIYLISSVNLPGKVLPLWFCAIIFVVISIVLLLLIRKFSRKITSSASAFLDETFAIETNQFENDFAIIDSGQNEVIARQKGFYFSFITSAKFNIYIAAIICSFSFITLSASLISSSFKNFEPSQNPVILSSSCGIFLLLLMLITSVSISRFIAKSSVDSLEQAVMTEKQFTERIKVNAREVAGSQIIDFDKYNEQIIEYEYNHGFNKANEFTFISEQTDNESSYEMLADIIKENSNSKVILMTGINQNDLPCTIPVNTAMKIVETNRKTLIIDFDLKRASITEVFDIGNCRTKIVKTCINNLFLFSAVKLAKTSSGNLKPIFEKIDRAFDHIIIYAPDISEITEREYFLDYIDSTILFASENQTNLDQNTVEKLSNKNCRILQPQMPLSVV